jgi:hypothetical protein
MHWRWFWSFIIIVIIIINLPNQAIASTPSVLVVVGLASFGHSCSGRVCGEIVGC